MTDKTRTELVLRAMQLLVPLASGDYDAADLTLIDDQVETFVANLNDEGYTYLGDTDAYPPGQFQYLALLLAHVCAHDMGLAAMPLDQVATAQAGLRLINSAASSRAVLATDYF